MPNDMIKKTLKKNFAKVPTFIEVSPIPICSSALVSPSPIEETMVAKREILRQGIPARYSSIKKAFRHEASHLNKLQETMDDLEKNDHRPKTAPITDLLFLKNKMDQPIKYLRRHMTITGDTNSLNRYNSSDLIRYTLHDKDVSKHNSVFAANNMADEFHKYQHEDNLKNSLPFDMASDNDYVQDNISIPPNYYHAVIQQPNILLSSSYCDYNLSKQINELTCQSLTPSSPVEAHLSDSNHSSTQFSSPKSIPSHYHTKENKNSGTTLTSSTLPQSFLSHLSLMNNKTSPLLTKKWFPYFTCLTTMIMFIYFIASITINFRITGM